MNLDWDLVAALIRRSFTGTRLTPEEQLVIQRAYRCDPQRYTVVGEQVRAEERSRVMGR